MGMADRIIVMHEGLMVAEYQAGEATAETIVSAASGIGERQHNGNNSLNTAKRCWRSSF
jgi:ABC-type antimicrobial peptide transport system ATPase subunit